MTTTLAKPLPARRRDYIAAKTWIPPRTPDGQPELQEIWTIVTQLQRPTELAGKEFLKIPAKG